MRGALNLFQSNMLRWRAMHPYNAVHAVEVDRHMPRADIESAIAATLEHWGLTGLALDGRRGRYEYRGGPARSVLTVVAGARMLDTLEAEIERQLNTPFEADGALDPFRFFLASGADGTMLGLAYDHFIAAGDSIVELLQSIVARCAGEEGHAAAPLLYPPRQGRLYRTHWRRALAGLGRVPAQVRNARRTARPRYGDAMDGHNGYRLYLLPADASQRLPACAKAWSVTVNDVLLALLLLALDPLVPQRRGARQRVAIGVASIMNLRSEFGAPGRAAFGQFLGSLRVAHPVPDGIGLERLSRDVHAETEQVKREKLYLQTLIAMRWVKAIWPLLDPAQRAGFYAKTYPLHAGLSAMNLNALWRRSDPAKPLPVYIRGVPTGPLAPLVVAFTTVGERFYAGISYRTAAFDRDDVDHLWTGLTRRLTTLP